MDPSRPARRRTRTGQSWQFASAIEAVFWLALAIWLGWRSLAVLVTAPSPTRTFFNPDYQEIFGPPVWAAALIFLVPFIFFLIFDYPPIVRGIRRLLRLTDETPHVPSDIGRQAPLDYLETLAEDCRRLTRASLKRSNVHLLTGVVVGLAGAIWFVTSTPLTSVVPDGSTLDTALVSLVRALPRVAILVFIEAMAGFFLKQYRAAMIEFCYFQAVQRQCEMAVLAFIVHREYPGDQPALDIAMRLIEHSTTISVRDVGPVLDSHVAAVLTRAPDLTARLK